MHLSEHQKRRSDQGPYQATIIQPFQSSVTGNGSGLEAVDSKQMEINALQENARTAQRLREDFGIGLAESVIIASRPPTLNEHTQPMPTENQIQSMKARHYAAEAVTVLGPSNA